MKRLFVFLLLFVIGVTIPFGCSTNNGQENTLSLYNWSSYIDPSAIADFEQKFVVKIKYDTYESNDDLYAKLKPGNPGYDVIFPSDYMVTIMRKENMLEAIELNNIPNIKNVKQKFLNPPYDPGNQYSLPYQWQTIGIGYNIQATGKEITGWSDLFNYQKAGRVSLLDELRDTMSAALLYLGYDPNTTNPDQLNQARDLLIEKKDLIKTFAPDIGQNLLDQGEVDLALEYSGDIFQVMEENPNLRYVIPTEGAIIAADTMAIPKDAPHKEMAEKFINFILEPEIGAKISNFTKYGTPNQVAQDKGLINREDLNNKALYPPEEVFERLTYIKDVGEATAIYDRVWTEIKAGIG
jgi:spermidine/putrescine transport system substrate-binding protein